MENEKHCESELYDDFFASCNMDKCKFYHEIFSTGKASGIYELKREIKEKLIVVISLLAMVFSILSIILRVVIG